MPFNEELPKWKPNNPDPTPTDEKLERGFSAGERPPASIFNWFFNRTYRALKILFDNAIHKETLGKPGGPAILGENGKLAPGQENAQTIKDASTEQKGIVQLSDATNSNSTLLAATANAVKKVWDLAFAKYSKPTNGIPKADLEANVRTSLGKADTAIQESQKNVPNGYLGLTPEGAIPDAYKPKRLVKIAEVDFASNPTASFAVNGLADYKYLQPVLKGISHNQSTSAAIYLTFGNFVDTDFMGYSIIGTTVSALSNRASYRVDVQTSPAQAFSFAEVFKEGLLRTRGLAATTTTANPNILSSSSYFIDSILRQTNNSNIDTLTISITTGLMISGKFELWGEK